MTFTLQPRMNCLSKRDPYSRCVPGLVKEIVTTSRPSVCVNVCGGDRAVPLMIHCLFSDIHKAAGYCNLHVNGTAVVQTPVKVCTQLNNPQLALSTRMCIRVWCVVKACRSSCPVCAFVSIQ